MPIPSPNLDDRDFNQLVEEALHLIQQASPQWTDLSPSDPGRVLLELFAHLTETMLYRLNRIPEKAYIEFLRLIGVRLQPPVAASLRLLFSRSIPSERPVEIPRNTRVTVSRPDSGAEPPVFVTVDTVLIAPGETEVDVLAYHADHVDAELAGIGTGLPGLSLQARRPPIIAPTGDERDLIVGVEATPDELDGDVPVIAYAGKVYRIWREVPNFANLGPDPFVYIADRMAGTVTFAPAARMRTAEGELGETPQALAAIPTAGREIRLWYRRGGGALGNVAAETLTVLKDPITGVEVTNTEPATGGRDAETVENALVRGPQELHALHRAVTARDFELIALNSSPGIARARAFTRREIWVHAARGTVEVLLVPFLPEEGRVAGRVTAAALRERETETARLQIQRVLDERRPLGTTVLTNWARYKSVQVRARLVARREADLPAIRRQVLENLHRTINPHPMGDGATGWPFGQALHVSRVYAIAQAEPGVLRSEQVRLLVEAVPDENVESITADIFQPHTWYAGSSATLFRSLNDGEGWEEVGRFSEEHIQVVCTHAERPGLLAVTTRLPDGTSSRIHISRDSGESWDPTAFTTAFSVRDVAWMLREGEPLLLLATDEGLFELLLRPDSGPVQVLVDPQDSDKGFYAVVATRDLEGLMQVAVAAQRVGGVYLSTSATDRLERFRRIDNVAQGGNIRGEDIRVLAVQREGPRRFIWAGAAAAGGDPGTGCFRWELRGEEDPPEGWRRFTRGWDGGSCRALGFQGTRVVAATHRRGVMYADAGERDPAWSAPDVNSGLPLRDPGRFHPVDSVATDPDGRWIMAGSVVGVYRSEDGGIQYQSVSEDEFLERVTLPPTWLFVSGAHEITVVSEDEAV